MNIVLTEFITKFMKTALTPEWRNMKPCENCGNDCAQADRYCDVCLGELREGKRNEVMLEALQQYVTNLDLGAHLQTMAQLTTNEEKRNAAKAMLAELQGKGC